MELDWNTLDVDSRLLDVVQNTFYFKQMTPVQKAVIPLMTNYKDVLCEAVTGSGKSVAFIISLLQILVKHYQKEPFDKYYIGGLIISPTRELSTQTFDVLQKFLAHPYLSSFLSAKLFIGGNNPIIDGEKYLQEGANIFVVTPGRMMDLLERYSEIGFKLRKCLQVLIIDETDVLLHMGFDKEVNEILSYLPKQRRTGLFSATQTKLLTKLLKLGLRNPIRVEIKEKNAIQVEHPESESKINKESSSSLKSTGLQISPYLKNHYVVLNSSTHKISFLLHFMKKRPNCKFLLFFATCAQVDLFSKAIEHHFNSSIPIFKIHRKLKAKRQKIFEKYKNSESGAVMLCTDVMSRGIDVPNIDWVVNVDLPDTLQDYIHRSGRSGHQIGVQGNSLVLCLTHEVKFVDLCKSKGVPIVELKAIESDFLAKSRKITEWLRSEARKSCKFYEKTVRAFASFVRNYCTKNLMSEYLKQEIDFIDLANSYGLLKVPFMPELKNRLKSCPSRFEASKEDKQIALKHSQDMKMMKEKTSPAPKEAPRNALKVTEQRRKMKEKIVSCKLKGKKKKRFIDQVEFDELAEDSRMVKKLKKGLISQSDFDKHFGLD